MTMTKNELPTVLFANAGHIDADNAAWIDPANPGIILVRLPSGGSVCVGHWSPELAPSVLEDLNRAIGAWARVATLRCVCDHIESSHTPDGTLCRFCDCPGWSPDFPEAD